MVWHSSRTQENKEDIERTQKTFCKLILQEKYKDYENTLLKLNLVSLENRRQDLCLKFANSGIKYETLNDLFPTSMKEHNMKKTRNPEVYKVQYANTERLKKGTVITMQNHLNNDANKNRTRNVG